MRYAFITAILALGLAGCNLNGLTFDTSALPSLNIDEVNCNHCKVNLNNADDDPEIDSTKKYLVREVNPIVRFGAGETSDGTPIYLSAANIIPKTTREIFLDDNSMSIRYEPSHKGKFEEDVYGGVRISVYGTRGLTEFDNSLPSGIMVFTGKELIVDYRNRLKNENGGEIYENDFFASVNFDNQEMTLGNGIKGLYFHGKPNNFDIETGKFIIRHNRNPFFRLNGTNHRVDLIVGNFHPNRLSGIYSGHFRGGFVSLRDDISRSATN